MSIGIVQTKYGKLQGVEAAEGKYKGLTYFKGVRYAADTSGANRWRPPQEQEAWDGVKVCDTYAPTAPQPHMGGLAAEPYAQDFYYDGFPTMSEDCLFLNITTGAQSADEKRPVFMWFHGGGLGTGYSYEREFENSELAKKGVVVVTVGQRLNVFGYLALPQLSAEQGGKSGNYGFMDEVAALDWVYENIAAFGGDPENITIGGQSGGTAKSGVLAGSPKQKGRVKRVINQSNLNWVGRNHNTVEQAEKIGLEFLDACGISRDATIEELRALPMMAFYEKSGFAPMAVGATVADGDYIENVSQQLNVDKYASHCDYISGGNYGEMYMRPRVGFEPPEPVTEEQYYELAKGILGDLYDKYEFEKNFPCKGDADQYARYMGGLGLSPAGGTFNAPASGTILNRYFGAYRKAKGMTGNTYTYYFTRVAPSRPEEKGTARDCEKLLAWHSSELWYTFASLRKNDDGVNEPPARPWTDYDVKLADIMSSYWANFMKTGDPNGEGLPLWPKSDEGYGWIDLGDEVVGHYGTDDLLDKMLIEMLEGRDGLPR